MDVSRNPPAPEELLAEMVWLRRLASRIASDVGLAEDAFQDTMLAAVRHGPAARTNLRGWLGAVLRNAVRRRATHERRLEAREKVWARGNEWSRREPLDVSERFALEHDLSRAVHGLEEDLRLVVLLRFLEGRSLREISERVGAPISTVDARLSRALALLRARLERSHGEGADGARRFRAALLSYLVPEGREGAPAPRVPWVTAALVSGATGLIVLFAGSDPPEGGIRSATTAVVSEQAPARPLLRTPHEPPSTAATPPRVPLEPIAADPPWSVPATGSAEIRLVDEAGGPLAHLVVALWPGESAHPLPRPLETEADGHVLFRGLRAGSYVVATDRLQPRAIEVRAGATVQATFAVGAREISGVVVDEAGMPVADALVWVSASPGGAFFEGAWTRGVLEDVATTRTDAEGRFRLGSCGAVRLVGARASDRAPTSPMGVPMERAPDPDPHASDLRLVLAGAGGALEGRVLGPEGPLADALVLVEAFEGDRDTEPLLAARSDASGEFRLVGIASGERAVTVRAAGLAPWRGSARVEARSTAWVTARLEPGACLAGVVRDRAGQPVAQAELRWSSTESRSEPGLAPATVGRSLADGSYLLPGLLPEEGRLSVLDASGASVLVTLALSPGERRVLDPVLEPAREVRGLLRDEDGSALEGLALVLSVESSDEVARGHSDASGRFALSVSGPGELRLRVFEGAWPVLEECIEESTVGPDADLTGGRASRTRSRSTPKDPGSCACGCRERPFEAARHTPRH